jgi:hypothetical protein
MATDSSLDKHDVLEALDFGARVAEEEKEGLADYFVETDQWRRVVSGQVDVVFGTKGSGKSAIYTSLMNRESELGERGIILMTAEKPRGNTVFQSLKTSPPTGEIEFVSIWKLYILTLLGSVIAEYGLVGSKADQVKNALAKEGLLPKEDATLNTRFRMVWDWITSHASRAKVSAEAQLDPATQMPVIGVSISLQEPSTPERASGVVSLDDLLEAANAALDHNQLDVWVLFDRLDVAFSDSHELEANGIRALFKAYLDMRELERIGVKIFLRTDIWDEVTAAGFREASHITRQLRIEWDRGSLLNLVVRRALRVSEIRHYFEVDADEVLQRAEAQRAFFDKMVPEKVDVGKNPETFEWILGRVQDGSKHSAPREVIHLLNEARDAQLRMLERGEQEPPERQILSRVALRDALQPVSAVRLEQTLYAEYPQEKPWVQALEGEKTEHTVESLSDIWDVSASEATSRAQRLVDIGFWEQRGDRDASTYWVPFLYRHGLHMRQGQAA